MKETRKISMSTMRQLAIKENWFTHASNTTYSRWLDLSNYDGLSTEMIVEMAEIVVEYSDIDSQIALAEICFIIADASYTFFETE